VLENIKKIEKDIWIIILLVFISTYTIFNMKHWDKEDRVIVWDVVDYYGYLPATFIYGDVTLEYPNKNYKEYKHTFWFHKTDKGSNVFKMSMGMSILYSPFFFMAHAYSSVTESISSGFSPPYRFAICISGIFYFVLGLIFLRKLMRNFFSENIVAITLLFIGLGTNLFYYVVIGVGMPHNYLFGLFSVALYFVFKWYKKPSFALSGVLGFLLGLVVLVRPTMILVLTSALFFEVNSIQLLKERIFFYKNHILKIVTIILFSILTWVPQFIYWKIVTGSFIYYSYTDQGFFFDDPQIFNLLFSFRNGWLLYSPLMIFSLLGLLLMFVKKEKLSFGLTFTIVLYVYVMSCWWVWWFGGSFSSRTMIDILPLLALGLAYFIKQLFQTNRRFKKSILTLMFLIVGFNLFQIRQAHEGLLHHDSMTKEAYSKIFFKLQSQITRKEVKPYLETPDYESAKKGLRD
tara:strand:- start:4319 stop:5698 length:1380 start_codon:yes stop_codon:yes gene_type:complete